MTAACPVSDEPESSGVTSVYRCRGVACRVSGELNDEACAFAVTRQHNRKPKTGGGKHAEHLSIVGGGGIAG